MSEVRGSGREFHTVTAQEWLRGATPRPRSGRVAERRYPASEVRGGSREELPDAGGQGRWPGGPPPLRRPEAAAGRTNPTSKERWLQQAQKGLE